MDPLDALKPFARQSFRWEFMERPFVLGGVAYGSDTRCMVSLPAPGEADTPGLPPKFPASLPGMYPANEPTGFDADDLRQWLGEQGNGPPCDLCAVYEPPLDENESSDLADFGYRPRDPVRPGTGCPSCDGGYGLPIGEGVRVFGSAFDALYLRKFLSAPFAAGVPFGTFGRKSPANPLSPASFTVGLARMLLMPMDIAPAERLAELPQYVPGIGPLWHLRATDKRFVLDDWCQERDLVLTDLEGVPAGAGEGVLT